ncbi:MAG: hypothetical protein DRG34_05835 [Deltaproteobacteria bacterium]|nr:MAG: hypothetical protein DRG34_05835 [Deltaproteobacteria bacterium]
MLKIARKRESRLKILDFRLKKGLLSGLHRTQRSGRVYNIYIIYYTTNNRCNSKKNRGRVRVAKTIIIKNFPEDLHRRAKAKAALEGITLKALIIKLLETYLEEFRT